MHKILVPPTVYHRPDKPKENNGKKGDALAGTPSPITSIHLSTNDIHLWIINSRIMSGPTVTLFSNGVIKSVIAPSPVFKMLDILLSLRSTASSVVGLEKK